MTGWRRFARFNLVGLGGVGVQLAVLAALTAWAGVHYLPATAAAVTAAVLHNFLWHRHWTWADRLGPADSPRRSWAAALARFAGANGLVSVAGNLAVMPVLVDGAGMPAVAANVAAIVCCGVLNYTLGDRVVFPEVTPNPVAPCEP